jgi:integrase
MKIDFKGIHTMRRRLADGTVRTHYYLGWHKGAAKLKGEPGSPEFIESYRRATKKRKTEERTTETLIDDYFDSGHFLHHLSPRTQEDYRKLGARFRAKFGATPIRFWKDPRSKKKLRKWRDKLAVASARQADYMWSFMSAVFTLAVNDGELIFNPCAKGGRLYAGSRVEVIWTSPQVGAFLHQRRYAHMHLPLLIGLWTGQREGDILRLRWSAYDGAVIRLKQRKGQRRGKKKNSAAIVVIPVAGPLKVALDAELAARKAAKISPLRLEDEMICLNSEGEPWREGRAGYNGFISSFKKAKDEAGIEGINFSDLRGTAVTRLALAGCTVPEICAITGHSHDEANAILQAHYLHRDPQIAWKCHPEAGGIHGRNRNRRRNPTYRSTERNG